MEWNLRLILLLVVIVLLVIIIIDGFLRTRRKGGVKMRAKRKKPHNQGKDKPVDDGLRDILGPARVVSRSGASVPTLSSPNPDDSLDVDDVSVSKVANKINYQHSDKKITQEVAEDNSLSDWEEKQQDLFTITSNSHDTDAARPGAYGQAHESKAKALQVDSLKQKVIAQQEQRKTTQPKAKASAPEHMLVLFVSAEEEIKGDELLAILIEENCRLGEMNIFHCYEEANGEGESLFSISNAVKPWKFNINNMESENYQGLCLLMNLPGAKDNMLPVFDEMVVLAKKIAEKSHSKVLDDKRGVITEQTLEHYRQSITDYQHKKRIPNK